MEEGGEERGWLFESAIAAAGKRRPIPTWRRRTHVPEKAETTNKSKFKKKKQISKTSTCNKSLSLRPPPLKRVWKLRVIELHIGPTPMGFVSVC